MTEELKVNAAKAEAAPAADVKPEREFTSEVGIIARGTKVVGDIVTDGHLSIDGDVDGNIDALGDVNVTGNIKGDVKCSNFTVGAGVLKINIVADGEVAVGKDARIEGDIRCKSISAEGRISGNIFASESIKLASTAVVTGELATRGIAIGMGAVVNGKIKMNDK